MIRYRTRDLTRLLPPSARAMRRIEKITGRTDDMLIIRGVNLFPTQIEELILKQPELVPHYQLEISRPHNLDEMVVLVERTPANGRGRCRRRGWRIRSGADRRHGRSVVPPGTIERRLAARRVVDKRTKG